MLRSRRAWAVLLLGSLASCRGGGERLRSAGPGDVAEEVRAGPAAPRPAEVLEAERALRSGDPAAATQLLERAGGISLEAPERSWLLVDLYLARARTALARERTAACGEGALAEVLVARAWRRPPQPRTGSDTPEVAPWFDLASALAWAEAGDEPRRVEAYAQRARRRGPAFVRREALLVLAHEALEEDQAEAAVEHARAAAREDALDPRPPAVEGSALARLGRPSEASAAAARSLLLAPRSARTARRLADIVREGPTPEAETRLRRELRPLLEDPEAGAEVLALRGVLAERSGDLEGAGRAYTAALGAGADPIPVERHLRRLLWRAGHLREAFALLRLAAPPGSRETPGSLQREAWANLDAVAAQLPDGPGAPGDDERYEALGRALIRVGCAADARAALANAPGPRARATARRAEALVAFVAACQEVVEEGYRARAAGRPAAPLARVRARWQDAARRHLEPEEVEAFSPQGPGLRSIPLLGAWLDHAAHTTSPTVAWFRRHGWYLMLGERAGEPPEAILLAIACLVPGAEIATQGRLLHHDLAIGFDRALRARLDQTGGALSGAALPDGLWLDADAARREDHLVRAAARGADPTLVAWVEAAGRAPPFPDGPAGPFALDDTAGLALRLARRHVAGRADPWGAFGVLRAHESGHVLDLARHLPIAKGLPASLALVGSAGFSIERVEARLEGRAQLAALADAPDPTLALLDLVRPLPLRETSPEVHDRGYRDVVAALLQWVERHAQELPALDPQRKLLPQLDRLTDAELRRAARALLAQGWPEADPAASRTGRW